ncbi:Ig-like domain repeat protein [Xanthobacter sp. KR7-65]|uniref:Ig-like domain repeat protein n=1 Tax=Xanthobacter sp. KR7-65 TaxID=3156612 RepID=UPI0032B5C6C1
MGQAFSVCISSLLSLALWVTDAAAQDRRLPVEPTLPAACATFPAPLRIDATGSPIAGNSAAEEDAKSARQTQMIQAALQKCPSGRAVRLTLGAIPTLNAFLVEPLSLPLGVSLVIDGGVTVFASRNPARFQMPDTTHVCGTVTSDNPIYGACQALITFGAGSGVYGYGILDGQAQRGLIRNGQFTQGAWWDLLQEKQKGCGATDPQTQKSCEQASPPMIYAGPSPQKTLQHDMTLYKITIRNPPFHTVMIGGIGVTIWGVKVQSPWNVPNSDGFDLNGSNILVRDVTIANGDQDVVLTAARATERTRYVTVEGATLYGKGGVALLAGDGAGISNVVVNDLAMTGQVASFKRETEGLCGRVLINGIDPTGVPMPNPQTRLTCYSQALPNATGDLQGMQLDTNLRKAPQVPGFEFSDILFNKVCLKDVARPFRISPTIALPAGAPKGSQPVVQNVWFKDVHVLAPSEQFPAMQNGVAQQGSGSYLVQLSAEPGKTTNNRFKWQNLVFDDVQQGVTPLTQLTAVGNNIFALENIYPSGLNHLDGPAPKPPLQWTLQDNHYPSRALLTNPSRANPCPAERWSFLTGELYLAQGTNAVAAGSLITLNAVLQPAMSQTTWYVPNSYGVSPGLLSIGSPALTGPVQFYDGQKLVGTAKLQANGTLATLTLSSGPRGGHTFTARYPGDAYYKPFSFGGVRLKVL